MNDPYAPPGAGQYQQQPQMDPNAPRDRGGCLTALLILMMVVNPLTGLVYLAAGDAVKRTLPSAPDWAIPMLTIACFAQFAFALAMFRYKRWGLYGSLGLTAMTLVVNLYIGINPVQAIMGAAALPSFLIVLIKPRWHMFT